MAAERRRKPWRWLVVGALVAAALTLVLRETEEDRILARLEQLSVAARLDPDGDRASRKARIERAFGEIFAADVQVKVPGLPTLGSGREELVATAVGLEHSYREVAISFEQPGVQFDPSGQVASVQTRVAVSGRTPAAGLLTDTRDARLRLRKADGRWQITAVDVAPPIDEEPEPRP